MPFVLVIEPDSGHADTLQELLTRRPDTDVFVVTSKDAAVATVDERVPDLVLVHALMSPRDEDALIAHLRTLPDAGHLQTLTIPQLGQTTRRHRRVRSFFGRSKKQSPEEASGNCDPTQFVNEVAAYLSRACEAKAEGEALRAAQADRPAGDAALDAMDEASSEAERPVAGNVATEERLPTGAAHFGIGASDNSGWDSVEENPAGARSDETLAAELDRVRAEADQTLAVRLDAAEERHRADIVRLEAEAGERADAAAREAQTVAEAQANEELAAESDRVRTEAERRLADELTAAEERHRADIARLEHDATERADAAAQDAQTAAVAQADATLAAESDRVRADAKRRLADELNLAEERHRGDIARLQAEAGERSNEAAREAQRVAQGQAAEALNAEVERLRADAAEALATGLAAAEERRRADISRLEAEAAARAETAARDAQTAAEREAARALSAEVDRVRIEAEQALATRLADAEARRRADVARLEAEVAERADAAARGAREAAEAQAHRALSAEVDRLRAEADQTLAAELATAEARHRGEIARVETEAAEVSDAARDAQATAEAEAGEAIAAERERVRHDAERTLVDELASAQERHHADIAALNAEATARNEVATRAAQAAAEALAEDTLATERARLQTDADLALATALAAAEERHRAEIARLEAEAAQADESAAQEPAPPADAQAIHTLEAELDRVRADAERTLAAELAAAEARNRTEILRVRADTQESLADQLEQVQAEADQARNEVARLVAARQTSASRELRPNVESASWRSAAGSTSVPRHAAAGPVGPRTYPLRAEPGGESQSGGATDYYSLWTARFDGDTAPPAPTPTEPPSRRGRARRRWALAAAAILVILLTNDYARDSPLGRALSSGATGVSQMVGPPGTMPPLDDVTTPLTEVAIDDTARGSRFLERLTSHVSIEAVGLLIGLLFMLVTLFLGEGLVWHGLVVTFAVLLLGFIVLHPPSSVGTPTVPMSVSGESNLATSPGSGP